MSERKFRFCDMFFSAQAASMASRATDDKGLDLLEGLKASLLGEDPLLVKEKIDAICEAALQSSTFMSRRLARLSQALWASIEAPEGSQQAVVHDAFFYILGLMQKDCLLENLCDLPCKGVCVDTQFTEGHGSAVGNPLNITYHVNPMEALILNNRASWIHELAARGWGFSCCAYEESPGILPEATAVRLHIFSDEALQQFRYYAISSWFGSQVKNNPNCREECLTAEKALGVLMHPLKIEINSENLCLNHRAQAIKRPRPFWI